MRRNNQEFKIGDTITVSKDYDEIEVLVGLSGKIVDIEGGSFGIDFGIEQASKLPGYPDDHNGLWQLSSDILPEPTGRYIPFEFIVAFDPNHDREE